MRIRRAVLDAIAAHARRESPRECCGLLIGENGEVAEAVATDNIAPDPLRRYEVSPADHFAQIRRCRASGSQGPPTLSVVGVYHSHPHSAPEPSPTDLEQAFEEFLYIIAGPVNAATPIDIRGYRLKSGCFEPAELIVT